MAEDAGAKLRERLLAGPEPTLRDADKSQDSHAHVAGVLHDVSNTLTVILGWASEARSSDGDDAAMRHALEVIEDQAQIARELARQAIGAGGDHGDEETQLALVLASATDALKVEAARAGVRLQPARPQTAARIRRSSDLRQVVTNLVLNALAHAPAGSKVTLDASVGPTLVTLDVTDEGPGIAADRHESIFAGDSRRPGGAGIGLRHARAVARAASGDLTLASSSPAGTTFRLTWPRWGGLSLPPPSTSKLPVLEGSRVLIVEDDDHVALLLETALTTRGASVRIARDLSEFDVSVDGGEHDIALIDLSPIAGDLNGALSRLRKGSPDAAFVIISGSVAALPDEKLLDNVRWVRKPFEVSEVVAAVLASRRT